MPTLALLALSAGPFTPDLEPPPPLELAPRVLGGRSSDPAQGGASRRAKGPTMNQTLRFGLDYQFRSVNGTQNPYTLAEDGTQQFLELSKGGHSLGISMEGWAPIGTIGLGIMLPMGGSVQIGDSDNGEKFPYRNATVWNFHVGPGLMSRRGLGIYAGYSYKYHHINFKEDLRVPSSETVQYVLDSTFSRSTGPFLTAFVPLGSAVLVGADFRGGGLREGPTGERDEEPYGRYHEASLILFFHSTDLGADGLYLRIGRHAYDIDTPGGTRSTGGALLQIGMSYGPEAANQSAEEWNDVLNSLPTGTP